MANRICERCRGAMPNRTHRQRDSKGHLVCDSCKGLNMPEWSTKHSSLSLMAQSEMRRREAEAIVSISRVARLQREAHDSGDNAVINHCPFCGSGAVVKSSDGSTSCDYCHNNFTVQVQPNHPNMPQTIDGQSTPAPGMPGDDPANPDEISGPDDPATQQDSDGVASDSLSGGDPTKSNGPVAPGQPPSKQPAAPGSGSDGAKPNPFAKKDDAAPGAAAKPDDGKKKSLPPWLKKKTMRTATGAVLPADDYLAHLALAFADDRTAVLDSVRLNRVAVQHQAVHRVECPNCDGSGEIDTGQREHDTNAPVTRTCGRCGGNGELDADDPDNFELRQPPHEGSMRPFSREAAAAAFYHGTSREFSPGDRILPAHETGATRVWPASVGKFAYATYDPDEAADYAQIAANRTSGQPHVYEVKPLGKHFHDPSTPSARYAKGWEVVREVTHGLPEKQAASGLTKHRVPATEVQVGDYLDSSGKVRVHNTHTRGDTVMLAWRLRGSKAPGVRDHHIDETVSVWRR